MTNSSWRSDHSAEDALEGARPSLWSSAERSQSPTALTPTLFINVANDLLAANLEAVEIVGEVASFKVNQGKWVFFDIKDDEAVVPCFMTLWNMRTPLEDGMKVVVRGTPKLTKWGKFSLTVNAVRPVGEGSLKKAFEMLKKKLMAEGLFNPERKRGIPEDLTELGVISSTQAAGYADFIKIINARWGGMHVKVAHTQVQGMDAPDQIIRALKYFNERGNVQMIAILRGGGSADDLSCFNDEALVREIAASKIPVITGIGHEIDESLADLAADVRASTPSNAAEMLTPDRKVEIAKVRRNIVRGGQMAVQQINEARKANYGKLEKISRGINERYIEPMLRNVHDKMRDVLKRITDDFSRKEEALRHNMKLLEVLNPEKVLSQGYAILAGKISPGSVVKITTFKNEIDAEIKTVKERK